MAWFEAYDITITELRLSECEHITNLALYIDSQLRSIRRNDGNPTFAADITRLKRLKEKLEEMV